MIECKVYHDGVEVARMRFYKGGSDDYGYADYLVNVAVERLGTQEAVGTYTVQVLDHPRLDLNALGLVKAALLRMTREQLSLEQDTRESDLARRFFRVVPALQGWSGRLRDYRSTLRRGQSVEHGEDPGG